MENWDELVFRGEKAYGSREMLHNPSLLLQ